MTYQRFPGRVLWEAGDYSDHRRADGQPVGVVDSAFLDAVAANTRQATSIPLDLAHADTDAIFDSGHIDPATVRRAGNQLLGDVLIPEGDEPRYRARGLSVVVDLARQVLTKCTVTQRPRVPSAAFSGDEPQAESGPVATFTGGSLMSEDQNRATQDGGDGVVVPKGLWAKFAAFLGRDETPKPEPGLASAFSKADVEALLAEREKSLTAAFDAKLAEATKSTEAQFSAASAAVVDQLVAFDVLSGVPAHIAPRLRKRLMAAPAVAKFEAEKPDTDTDAALFADVLAAFTANSPYAQQLPTLQAPAPATGDAEAKFESQYVATVNKLVDEAKVAGRVPNMADIARRADELCAQKGA